MRDGRRLGRFAIAGFVTLVAPSAGCKWLPVRHPDRNVKHASAVGEADSDEANLPPLPVMRTIDDDEAFQPAAPTPLLDAAASRDAALKRAIALGIEGEAAAPQNPPPMIDTPPVEATTTKQAVPDKPKNDRLVEPAAFVPPDLPIGPDTEPSSRPPVGPPHPTDDGSLWDYVLTAMAVAAESRSGEDARQDEPAVPAEPEFAISDLRICRRVLGFGRTESLATESLAPGRMVLLYCELEGIRDEESKDGFHSRLASSVAIVPETGGEPVWSFDLGVAEDHCRRRRRDFFVNYRVKIPESLAPGSYKVRLIQRDLLANREATRSVPITVRAK
jgi:hypothetical protein